MASHSWISTVLLAAYLAIFYPMVIRREQTELETLYGSAFLEYASTSSGVLAAADSRDAVHGAFFLVTVSSRIENMKPRSASQWPWRSCSS